jgi:hypothetical protein
VEKSIVPISASPGMPHWKREEFWISEEVKIQAEIQLVKASV